MNGVVYVCGVMIDQANETKRFPAVAGEGIHHLCHDIDVWLDGEWKAMVAYQGTYIPVDFHRVDDREGAVRAAVEFIEARMAVEMCVARVNRVGAEGWMWTAKVLGVDVVSGCEVIPATTPEAAIHQGWIAVERLRSLVRNPPKRTSCVTLVNSNPGVESMAYEFRGLPGELGIGMRVAVVDGRACWGSDEAAEAAAWDVAGRYGLLPKVIARGSTKGRVWVLAGVHFDGDAEWQI
jgi:hypothetical protein